MIPRGRLTQPRLLLSVVDHASRWLRSSIKICVLLCVLYISRIITVFMAWCEKPTVNFSFTFRDVRRPHWFLHINNVRGHRFCSDLSLASESRVCISVVWFLPVPLPRPLLHGVHRLRYLTRQSSQTTHSTYRLLLVLPFCVALGAVNYRILIAENDESCFW